MGEIHLSLGPKSKKYDNHTHTQNVVLRCYVPDILWGGGGKIISNTFVQSLGYKFREHWKNTADSTPAETT